MSRERFGEYLLRLGALTREEVSVILDEQRVSREEFGRVAVRRGYLNEEAMVRHLADFLGLPVLDPARITPDPDTCARLPKKMALKMGVFPMGLGPKGEFICACSGPLNMAALQSVGRLVGRPVRLELVSRPRLKKMQNELYSRQFDTSIRMSQVAVGNDDDLHLVTELVEKLLLRAINMDASDIHIEPGKREITVRFRVDGVLLVAERLPLSLADKINTRIKVISSLDIAEKRMPQDGAFFFQPEQLDVEIDGVNIRTSTLPVVYGEKVVMRILPATDSAAALASLGMEEDTLELFRELVTTPHGIILVTGPTGSGKSTTLYSVLQMLRDVTVNITTLEDPVELKMRGVNQTQINPGPKISFAGALRSILRQDPDIIMVGEIRDRDTIQVALQAAITGHLVFSTLHTNDAPSSFTRMLDMGAEPFLTASSVRGILAQRLVRRLCPHCREEMMIGPAELPMLKLEGDERFPVGRPSGCEQCGGKGYQGRLGIFELLAVEENIQRMVAEAAPTERIRDFARQRLGFRTLRGDGILKLRRGLTSPEEIMRVTMA